MRAKVGSSTFCTHCWVCYVSDTYMHGFHAKQHMPLLVLSTSTSSKRLTAGVVLCALYPQADLPFDVTKYALASINTASSSPGSCSPGLTVELTADVSKGGFVLGCRLVRPRSVEDVKQMLRPPPNLQMAVAELQGKVGLWAWLCSCVQPLLACFMHACMHGCRMEHAPMASTGQPPARF